MSVLPGLMVMSGPHSAKKERLVEFFAGIDGGGTRTSVLVESSDRSVSDKKVFPAFNFNSIGEAAFRSLVREILSWLETFGPCQKLCIGAAGISNARMSECLNDMLSSSSVVKSYEVTGDQVIAHYGALSGKEGIILIAGMPMASISSPALKNERRREGKNWKIRVPMIMIVTAITIP